MYTEFLLERALSILQRCVTVNVEECTRIPDEMKKLTIAPLVLSENDAVPKTFRNSLKHWRNFGDAGDMGEYPASIFFYLRIYFWLFEFNRGK